MLDPAGADVYRALAGSPDLDPGQWNAVSRRVLRRIELTTTGMRFVLATGEATTVAKPAHRRTRAHLPRNEHGRYIYQQPD